MGESVTERLRRDATGFVSTLVTAVWLGALVLGYDWWLAALLVGYVGVVPAVAILFGSEADREEWVRSDTEPGRQPRDRTRSRTDDDDEALAVLRDRYARGELTDAEFERKVEQLLATESVADAETLLADEDASAGGTDADEREPERS